MQGTTAFRWQIAPSWDELMNPTISPALRYSGSIRPPRQAAETRSVILARMVNAQPSAVVLIGRIFFIDFKNTRFRKPVLLSEKFPREVREPHLEITCYNRPAYPPPLSVLIGLNKSFLFIVKLIDELVYLILRQIVFFIHLVLQHILEP